MDTTHDGGAAPLEQIIARDMNRLRKEAEARRVLDGLRRTIRICPEREDDIEAVNRARAVFTDESAVIVARLIEAVDILWAILYASDGCVGHRNCAHSMEPWQRARDLLYRNEQRAEDERYTRAQSSPQSPGDVMRAHLETFGK